MTLQETEPGVPVSGRTFWQRCGLTVAWRGLGALNTTVLGATGLAGISPFAGGHHCLVGGSLLLIIPGLLPRPYFKTTQAIGFPGAWPRRVVPAHGSPNTGGTARG